MSTSEILLINYGVGNLRSVQKALQVAGGRVRVTSNPETVARGVKLVLPGVGAFGDGMRNLKESRLDEAIAEAYCRETPMLGICLGMQLFFEWSEELGSHAGLGLLPGCVKRFAFTDDPVTGLKIPHTGWNQILPAREDPLLRCLQAGDYVYFNHAFYCVPDHVEDKLACSEYGLRFVSMVNRGRLWGAQFHPEKSQAVGLQILKNFVEVC